MPLKFPAAMVIFLFAVCYGRGANPLPQSSAKPRTFVYCDDDMEPEL
jgi:hypothetical protein